MRVLIFEGSAAEVREALKALPLGTRVAAIESAGGGDDALDGAELPQEEKGRPFVSVDVARKVLSRRPLSREQRLVLKYIYDASPNSILASELQEKINYSKARFAGLMGAFGRRLVNTKGYVDPSWFFDNEWVDEVGCNEYRLPESVREAMRLERLAS